MILDDILALGIFAEDLPEARKLVTILGQEGMSNYNIRQTLLTKFPTTPWKTDRESAKNFSQKKEENANGTPETGNAHETNSQEDTKV